MGEILFDLQQQLQSQQDKLTREEVNILLNCKANSIRDFTIGAVVGSGLAWIATRKLNRLIRVNVSIGAALLAGRWRFRNSLDSCLDQILSLEGSLMQKELANIIVRRIPDDSQYKKLISKHFYSERVYDDNTSNEPRLRWRYRNFTVDKDIYSQPTHDNNKNHSDPDSSPTSDSEESTQVPMNSGITLTADPFESVMGISTTSEEIHDTSSTVKPKAPNRSQRRSHRRRRLQQQQQHESETINI